MLKSKFKVGTNRTFRSEDKQIRCVRFRQDYLNRLRGSYEVPKRIEILGETGHGYSYEELRLVAFVSNCFQSNKNNGITLASYVIWISER